MKLFCDNKATINIANNSVQHDRIKHVETGKHFIKGRNFDSCISKLGLIDTYAPTWRGCIENNCPKGVCVIFVSLFISFLSRLIMTYKYFIPCILLMIKKIYKRVVWWFFLPKLGFPSIPGVILFSSSLINFYNLLHNTYYNFSISVSC